MNSRNVYGTKARATIAQLRERIAVDQDRIRQLEGEVASVTEWAIGVVEAEKAAQTEIAQLREQLIDARKFTGGGSG